LLPWGNNSIQINVLATKRRKLENYDISTAAALEQKLHKLERNPGH